MTKGVPSKTKVCTICGDEFLPKTISQRYCTKQHDQPCPVCGALVPWNSMRDVPVCSSECRRKRTKQRNIEKYGVEHPMSSKSVQEKHRRSVMKHYGVEHPLQSEEVKQKAVNTNFEKFGSDWALGSKEFRERCYDTMLRKYGAKTSFEVPELREKSRKTKLEKYKEASIQAKKRIEYTHSILNSEPDTRSLPLEDKRETPVELQRKFCELLDRYGVSHQLNFDLGTQNYDIIIPSSKTLINLVPSKYNNLSSGSSISMDCNLLKTKEANRRGFRCIHVFDWDDWNGILDLVLPRRAIYARKCEMVKIVDPLIYKQFVHENHLQGSVKGALLSVGLIFEGDLVQVMSFGKSRYNCRYRYELLRLCSKKEVSVIGGASRLFQFVTRKMELDSIISYCDLSKFTGGVYTSMGMTLDHIAPPNIVWSKGNRRITSNLLRQRGFDQLFNTNYGKGADNELLMTSKGWLPVPDCGQKVFTFNAD